MTNVFVFKPKHELEHEQNLRDFIEFSLKLPPLNDKYDYESHYWEKVGNFTKFGANSRQRNPEELLDESVLPFAKAYMVYGGGGKAAIDTRFKAIRAIEAGFSRKKETGDSTRINITKLTAVDFNNAAEAAREALGAGAAYQAGRGLGNLHKFLVEKKIMTGFTWKNPINKPADKPVGDEADVARQNKMPDENAIMALAAITSRDTEQLSPRDINTTSTMAIMLSAPSRGSEPLYLLDSCIATDTLNAREAIKQGLSEDDAKELILAEMKKQKANKSSLKSTTIDESGEVVEEEEPNLDDVKIEWDTKITVKGLKWYSGKGYGHENKWLPTVVYEVVEKAVARLKEQSKEAREFAQMLEDSPNFPRHRLCPDVPEDQLLTMDEVALALGLDLSTYGDLSDRANRKQLQTSRNQLLKRKGIERKDFVVSLRDLNDIVRKGLPEGFPYIPFVKGDGVKVKWSQSLYAGFSNSLDWKKTTLFTELQIPTINTLNEDLAPTKKKNRTTGELASGVKSIFQRWGYGDLVITSHQLRHMLDTMAAVNGMDADMRAKWAMRSDPTHNKYYDHTTPEEYGADFIEDREAQIAANELAAKTQPESSKPQVIIATPRTIQELNTRASLSAHTTDFGMCLTSYMAEPCTKYRDCINCTEHVCIKGDDGKCERIRQRLKKEEKLLRKDEKAVEDGVQGAKQFYERRAKTVKRFDELLSTMENPDIPDGSLIKLKDIEDVTLLDRAMDANGKKRLPEIVNYQRLNNSQEVSVDELVGIESKVTEDAPVDDEDIFFDGIDELDEMYFAEDE
ncbi:integrase [Photobacterium sp. ZSDE20]|uniref:Integrase n=1 Tax=Photobacterium pectinilyticum TaxID=2906793 RepID=A0ABT1N5Q9_9GAMM|nr:integrase [Photobacterium sp. ZSDE20]MCQ1060066.1 integrase [Photobacterium sp. ZSDE20]MDD1827246.1 integrase [Photobacterium sp. ZSDE20]